MGRDPLGNQPEPPSRNTANSARARSGNPTDFIRNQPIFSALSPEDPVVCRTANRICANQTQQHQQELEDSLGQPILVESNPAAGPSNLDHLRSESPTPGSPPKQTNSQSSSPRLSKLEVIKHHLRRVSIPADLLPLFCLTCLLLSLINFQFLYQKWQNHCCLARLRKR